MKAIRLKRPVVPVTVDPVIMKNGKVLMIKRRIQPYIDYWVLPGGFVQPGEKVVNAVVREAKEETGLKVKVKKIIGYYDEPYRDPRGHTVSFAFLCVPTGGKLKRNYEGSEIKFFEKLPKKIGFDHRKTLMDAGIK